MLSIVIMLHDLRSNHNVGAILRTADAVGAERVIFSGTTPYPELPQDTRPPHVRERNTRAIAKTALGAERSLNLSYEPDLKKCLSLMKKGGYHIVALEQAPNSVDIFSYQPPQRLVLIVGSETTGLSHDILAAANTVLEIPMTGKKESLNAAVAAGIALYQLRNHGRV